MPTFLKRRVVKREGNQVSLSVKRLEKHLHARERLHVEKQQHVREPIQENLAFMAIGITIGYMMPQE